MASGILEEAQNEEYEPEEILMECPLPEPTFMADMECSVQQSVASKEIARSNSKKRPGRIASLFRLNKKKYDEMKEESGKFEF